MMYLRSRQNDRVVRNFENEKVDNVNIYFYGSCGVGSTGKLSKKLEPEREWGWRNG